MPLAFPVSRCGAYAESMLFAAILLTAITFLVIVDSSSDSQ